VAFICAVIAGIGWSSFVAIAAFILVTTSFIFHIINYFPETMLVFIIVGPMLTRNATLDTIHNAS